MTKEKTARLADILGLINRLAPPDLAEDWDNCGLQVGDPEAGVERILVCLDVSHGVLDAAHKGSCQLIVSHHPLIFKPLKRLSPQDSTGSLLYRAVAQKTAVVSAHTSLDRAADGLNDWLARRFALTGCKPLERPATGSFIKLVVYVPIGHEHEVMEAMFDAGAGHIGDYDRCSFRSSGTGTFRGSEGADPFIGTVGVFEEAEELRLETILPLRVRDRVVTRMIKAHPYEEVAYDLIPLANPRHDVGLGRIGYLPKEIRLADFAREVQQALEVAAVRMVGDADQVIRKVAVCGGSGMSVLADAMRQGADCLVTGDVKYHEAHQALAAGVAVIDAGHFATEKIMIAGLVERLTALAENHRYTLEVIGYTEEKDPFTIVM